jgi:hypothetical protein
MTNPGFEQDEIKNTTTEDLVNLKYSIAGYLKSKKLKKRNMKFMLVYQRITQELKRRNGEYVDLADSTTNSDNSRMLSRKVSRSIELTELEIPSFLNDKKEPKTCSDCWENKGLKGKIFLIRIR